MSGPGREDTDGDISFRTEYCSLSSPLCVSPAVGLAVSSLLKYWSISQTCGSQCDCLWTAADSGMEVGWEGGGAPSGSQWCQKSLWKDSSLVFLQENKVWTIVSFFWKPHLFNQQLHLLSFSVLYSVCFKSCLFICVGHITVLWDLVSNSGACSQ